VKFPTIVKVSRQLKSIEQERKPETVKP
jgi:hypothetical protein